MNAEQINTMGHDQIRAWLEKALRGLEFLPRLSPDESHYLAIIRLDKSLNSAARKSLRDGVLNLLRQFCDSGLGESTYIQELLSMASALEQPETPAILADLASRFQDMPEIPLELRFAVLGVLVDASPPQPVAFWQNIHKQDPKNYAALSLSGLLAANPFYAVKMLPVMPDTERAGKAAAINLDLAWDDLTPRYRSRFVEQVENILGLCGQHFADPVRIWAEGKGASISNTFNQSLHDAITTVLDGESAPKTFTPKLVCLDLAA